MTSGRVVIVGGGGDGDIAAFGLRKNGFDGEIAILSADSDRPYDRTYLSKEYLRCEIELSKVYLHEEDAYPKNRIELHLGQQVTRGTLAGRRLTLAGGTEIGFDVLILATGGSPRWLSAVPRAGNVFTLRSLRDSQVI